MKSDKAIDDGLYPADAKDALERWDKGDTVWSIEMGGLGPGYEQAIQVGIFETIRRTFDVPLPNDDKELLNKIFDDALREAMGQPDLKILDGLSGAQAGAIKNIAHQFVTKGWSVMDEVDDDRHIQVSKTIP